ncbi:DUF2207 domain-containing protein [Planococcus faecalis]|uniref:DUF2207 domain-containing protein n=1 Tax=Planococcus faecalis TaxID=1598147 RepID=A0ABN4XN38_9BACL|nr:DUF2207 domain-containing protein [Planococcus faecalis]AQU79352.1 hypothetical protein AJGP001_08775 [Planococcus faecalis]OHX51200.1 hypothetical protein BB777_17855 [Planococcus faecalis]
MHKKNQFIVLWTLLVFTLFPLQAFAVDYSISKVTIDAQVTSNGTVAVTENHTYKFQDDFNGIIREIVPKKGTSIHEFTASEQGKELKVEQDEELYNIFRSGENETITIELRYEIQGAVDTYADGAEFYWPFFDDRNDSDYEQMTITITPPADSEKTAFIGYDGAYQTGSLQSDGGVQFDMGKVLAGSNGDVRVIFDKHLFPSLPQKDGLVLADLAADKEQMANDAAALLAKQQVGKSIGNWLIPAAGAALLAFFAWAFSHARKTKQQAKPDTPHFFVPKQKMSIPATLYFTKSSILTPAVTAAALMELVRKQKIEQLSEEKFRLIDRNTEFIHEATLIELLFDKVGDGEIFETKELESYTKQELNHASYTDSITLWQQGIQEEVKQYELYDKHPLLRGIVGTSGLVFGVASIFFGFLELFPMMVVSIIIAIGFIGFCFYSPITYKGHVIREEWKQLRTAMKNLEPTAWNHLTQDEKMRAFSYLLGADEKSTHLTTLSFTTAYSDSAFADFGLFYNPVLLTGLFVAAYSSTSTSASASGAISAGGGVSGGGGGSGAF